jgi:hypothetical protein
MTCWDTFSLPSGSSPGTTSHRKAQPSSLPQVMWCPSGENAALIRESLHVTASQCCSCQFLVLTVSASASSHLVHSSQGSKWPQPCTHVSR